MKISRTVALIILFSLLISSSAFGRWSLELDAKNNAITSPLGAVDPAYCTVSHRIGQLVLAVSNQGVLAGTTAWSDATDCITGGQNRDAEYPRDSDIDYAFACCFWIGAVVGRDTMVSTGADGWISNSQEFRPAYEPFGNLIYRSIRFPEQPDLFEGAISEEDYIAVYSDTADYVDDNAWDGLPHRPLNIEVTQRSFAWSYSYAEDFILFDYEIRNIGTSTLEDVYMGFYNDSDVGLRTDQQRHTDDICGFRETFTSLYEGTCEFEDTVNIAYIADNDGDPEGGVYTDNSCPDVTGMRIVRTPADQLNVSFNWWISNGDPGADFGPRERDGIGRWPEEFRDFGTGGLGTPEGDYNKYYQLMNQEFDFDQILSATIGPTDPTWLYPPQEDIADVANGFDTRYLLSFGPFNIEPGQRLPISFAYVAGQGFHQDPNNVSNLPYNPDIYYANLDFSDLALNSTWAGRVYDNPGVDTDGDDNFGEFRVCVFDPPDSTQMDTIWYKGDGVPDFRGASPPPAPVTWLEPTVGGIRVRFNGHRSETTRDVFSRIADWEGYRVYVSRDEREGSFSVVASYDIEDYNKYVYNPDMLPEAGFELRDIPFTLDSLRVLYGSTFNPMAYDQSNPWQHPEHADSLFYFEPQDFNASELGTDTPIRKIYPNQPFPSSEFTEELDPSELTEDGYVKYYEYEIMVDSLLPSVEWFISVTAFDFGSPESDLQALESARSIDAQAAYPLSSAGLVESQNLKVFVYPNPYRADAGYRDDGFEGRMDTDRPDDRVREIHFANLPPRCTIRIYSLDGDLVRELEHDVDPSNPESTHHIWDMITRNTQMVVSGIYFWTVEADNGETQIGKLVVIM